MTLNGTAAYPTPPASGAKYCNDNASGAHTHPVMRGSAAANDLAFTAHAAQ